MSPERQPEMILAIDTATTRVVVALGTGDGSVARSTSWEAGYRHGETLLPAIERILDEEGVARSGLAGIVVGTGPGAFTGLRVGLATAKGLAHGLGIPLVGHSTAEALLSADGTHGAVLLLPAGPSDRILVRPGEGPSLLRGGIEPELRDGESLVAVDLVDRAPPDALTRGEAARAGLGAALLRSGVPRLPSALTQGTASLAALVPEYITLPRGARAGTGTVAWSRDPR